MARRPIWSAPTELSATRRLLPHSHPWNIAASPRDWRTPWLVTGFSIVPFAVDRISLGDSAAIRRSRPSAANRPSSRATSTSRPLNVTTRSIVIAIVDAMVILRPLDRMLGTLRAPPLYGPPRTQSTRPDGESRESTRRGLAHAAAIQAEPLTARGGHRYPAGREFDP